MKELFMARAGPRRVARLAPRARGLYEAGWRWSSSRTPLFHQALTDGLVAGLLGAVLIVGAVGQVFGSGVEQVLPSTNAPASAPAGALTARLSLAEARNIAFERNWDLLAARSDVDIATAQRIVAREFPNPTVSLSTAKISVDSEHPSSTPEGNGFWDRSYDSIAAINQLVEIGGKRGARKTSALSGFLGARARLEDARRLLNAGVTQAYVAVLMAEQKRQVLGDSAASLREEAKIAEVRQKAGDISSADKSQIDLAADRFGLDASAAEADARNARIALELLLGEGHPKGEIQLSDTLEPLAAMPAGETNLTASVFNRPDIIAAEEARKKAEADLRLQKAMRVPDPTFLFQYEHEPPDQPNTIGMGVSFPIPLWNRNSGNIAAAQATLEQSATQLAKISAQAVADALTAQTSYDEASGRWRRYRDDLLKKSQQIRDAVAFAYQKGGSSLLDLLSAQRNENDVRLATAQAAADTANALANLRAALGITQ